ncbi:uncharacterized protein LOC5513554 isoform X2 [Nematostella vectensis]|uniref:uncharacterized protein LOC5513554 isoform X2 n=1 Tax=Nematostella vectensis TaxID=45351 RepID=UPI00207714EF|nr:uncharacterized protein LOC5513554 isoform X2 [Nematostella vectensis]
MRFPSVLGARGARQDKPSWILNTLKNVKTLEAHVGHEVDKYMQTQSVPSDTTAESKHMQESIEMLETGSLPRGTKKVLAVFNIKDSQSQLGEWISLFLKAAHTMEQGQKVCDFVVITQSFVSRKALMECIARLGFLKEYSPQVEVICVLSSHSSSQGQVFSCTPTAVSHSSGFEEFCSLHDLAMACQDILGNSLVGLHISSCFTLKMDCSHAEWPVAASWLKTKLRCVLSGSCKEVYETGSQVCDLYLLLAAMMPSVTVGSCGWQLKEAVGQACAEEYPDLAREMGLQLMDPEQINLDSLMVQGTEDQVTPPGLVVSAVHIVFLVSEGHAIPQAIANALEANLSIRKASDIQFNYTTLPIAIDRTSSLKSKFNIHEKLDGLCTDGSTKFFFVALGAVLANPSTGLVDVFREWSFSRGGNKLYGVHFQDINSLQAYYLKTKLTQESAFREYRDEEDQRIELEHVAATGIVGNGDIKPHYALPVLLYLIHLAIGENGNRLSGKGIPSAVYSKKPVGLGNSTWTLEEVYMETSYVLSGLSRKSSLQLLSSPAEQEPLTKTVRNKPGAKDDSAPKDNSCNKPDGSTGDYQPWVNPGSKPRNCTNSPGSKPGNRTGSSGSRPGNGSGPLGKRPGNGSGPLGKIPRKCAGPSVCQTASSSDVANNRPEYISRSSTPTKSETNIGKKSEKISTKTESNKSILEKISLNRLDLLTFSSRTVNHPSGSGNTRRSERNRHVLSYDPSMFCSTQEEFLFNQQMFMDDSNSTDRPPSGVLGRLTRTAQGSEFATYSAIGESSNSSSNYASLASRIMHGDDVPGQDNDGSVSTIHKLHKIEAEDDGVVWIDKSQHVIRSDSSRDHNGTSQFSREITPEEREPTVDTLSISDLIKDALPVINKSGESPLSVSNKTAGEVSAMEVISVTESSRNLSAPQPPASRKRNTQMSQKSVSKKKKNSGKNGGKSLEDSDEEIDICSEWDSTSKGCQANFPPVNRSTMVRLASSEEKQDGQNTSTPEGTSLNSKQTKPRKEVCISPKSKELSSTTLITKNQHKKKESSESLTLPLGARKTPFSNQFVKHRPEESKQRIRSPNNLDDSGIQVESPGKRTPFEGTKVSTKASTSKTISGGSVKVSEPSNVLPPKGSTTGSSGGSTPSVWDESEDLPLMANVDEVLVKHYILDLTVDFDEKVLRGSIVLFLEPTHEKATQNTFQLCLDSTLVNVESVSEVFLPDDFKIPFYCKNSSKKSSSVATVDQDDDVFIECVTQRKKIPEAVIDLTSDGDPQTLDTAGEVSDPNKPAMSLFEKLKKIYNASALKNETTKANCQSDHVVSSTGQHTGSSSTAVSKEMVSSIPSPKANVVVNYKLPSSVDVDGKRSSSPDVSSSVGEHSESNPVDTSTSVFDRISTKENVASHVSRPLGGSTSPSPFTNKRTSPGLNESPMKKAELCRRRGLLDFLDSHTHGPLPYKGLAYSVYGWCIRVWKEGAKGKAWPRCVVIKYHTSPEGQSLSWATDQDGRPCVFSPGAYINNRSLMPCQEPPIAMSTWQAAIHVPHGCMALMSGNPVTMETTATDTDKVTFLFEMDVPLPCSTLAMAVGYFESMEGRSAICPTKDGPAEPVECRMIAVPSIIDRASDELLSYVPGFIEASCELLGPYPFSRLDLLILPKCFACMGLKNPNLVFLSQSVLAGDGSIRVRVAHEISHAWFGLLIGAKDWTEEWLSEGFSTYIEERIQARAEKWSSETDNSLRELRQLLRYRALSAEMDETDENLQCLRIKTSKSSSAVSAAEAIKRASLSPNEEAKPFTVVKNGQICSKKWTQVHYLKGYFLLHHMAAMVGLENFERFLYEYVQHYQGQLVTSEDFFQYFVCKFPNVSQSVKDEFFLEWLESPGLPKCLRSKKFNVKENALIAAALKQFEFWRKQDNINKRNKTMNIKRRKQPEAEPLEHSEQIVLMLEKLVERDALMHTTLRQLNRCYNFSTRNCEIRHRWCELVVKNKFTPFLDDVKHFLIEDQGMGIYLFGELIISGQARQRAMAEEVFEQIGAEMDRCTYQTVSDMIRGNSSSDS